MWLSVRREFSDVWRLSSGRHKRCSIPVVLVVSENGSTVSWKPVLSPFLRETTAAVHQMLMLCKYFFFFSKKEKPLSYVCAPTLCLIYLRKWFAALLSNELLLNADRMILQMKQCDPLQFEPRGSRTEPALKRLQTRHHNIQCLWLFASHLCDIFVSHLFCFEKCHIGSGLVPGEPPLPLVWGWCRRLVCAFSAPPSAGEKNNVSVGKPHNLPTCRFELLKMKQNYDRGNNKTPI